MEPLIAWLGALTFLVGPGLKAHSTKETPVSEPRYVDAVLGRDTNGGSSPEKAWRSLDRVNDSTYGPGATILFRSGQTWSGILTPKGSGDRDRPIILGRYGKGSRPLIKGNEGPFTLLLHNQEYWIIRDLEVTNFNEAEEEQTLEEWELENDLKWARSKVPLPHSQAERSQKCAIFVEAEDVGQIDYLHFKNLEIHGVNGDMSTKHNGGIFFAIKGEKKPTWFNDLLVEGCYIHDVDRTGVSNISSWEKRTRKENINWTPSRNIVIRKNVFERSGANALIIRVAESPLIAQNLFDHCSIKGSGNANFPFNCDNALIQFNEARFTKYNLKDADAGGFDSDYRCNNTVIQYNYSHNNEYGGVLVCCQGGDPGSRFNDGTVVRYNIFENNAHHTIRVSGQVTNTLIHDNLIVTNEKTADYRIIWHKSWKGYADNTHYLHNTFADYGTSSAFDLGESTSTSFTNNLYLGRSPRGRIDIEPSNPLPFFEDLPDRFKNLIPALERFWNERGNGN